jgi:hypothetical protein
MTRCFWCSADAVGTIFERDHFGNVCDVTPACDDHGERWDGTSVVARHPCTFDRSQVVPTFAAFIRQQEADEWTVC